MPELKEIEDALTKLDDLKKIKEELDAREYTLKIHEETLLAKETALADRERQLKDDLGNSDFAHAFLKFVQEPLDRKITSAFLTAFNNRHLNFGEQSDEPSSNSLQWLYDDGCAIALIPQKITEDSKFTFLNTYQMTEFPYGGLLLHEILTVLDALELLPDTHFYFTPNKEVPLVIDIEKSNLSIILAPFDNPKDEEDDSD